MSYSETQIQTTLTLLTMSDDNSGDGGQDASGGDGDNPTFDGEIIANSKDSGDSGDSDSSGSGDE